MDVTYADRYASEVGMSKLQIVIRLARRQVVKRDRTMRSMS